MDDAARVTQCQTTFRWIDKCARRSICQLVGKRKGPFSLFIRRHNNNAGKRRE